MLFVFIFSHVSLKANNKRMLIFNVWN